MPGIMYSMRVFLVRALFLRAPFFMAPSEKTASYMTPSFEKGRPHRRLLFIQRPHLKAPKYNPLIPGEAFSRAHGPDDRYHVLDALAALGPLLPDAVHVQRDARSPPK